MSGTRQGAAKARACHIAAATGRREDYYWLRDEQRLTRVEAAARLGVHPRTAQNWDAIRNGLKRRNPEDIARREQVVRRLNALGWSDPQIARQLDITRSGVYVIRHRLGLPAIRREAARA